MCCPSIFSGCISIHALREEGDVMGYITIFTERISIHALREEGDVSLLPESFLMVLISIHALREEGDRGSLTAFLSLLIFLSTPSARRATRMT